MYERELVDKVLHDLIRLTNRRVPIAVEVALGPGVDQNQAELAWKELTYGTEMADVHVIWERAYDVMVCTGEGHRFIGDDACPYCGEDGVVVEAAPPISLGHWKLDAA